MTPNQVTLQAHIDARLIAIEKTLHVWQAGHDKQHALEQQLRAAELYSAQTALEIGAKEYERRLLELNHAAGRVKEIQGNYILVDVYRSEQKDLLRQIDELKTDIISLRLLSAEARGKAVTLASVASILISLAISIVMLVIGRIF